MATQTRSPVKRIGIDEVRQKLQQLVLVDARSATSLARNPRQALGAIHVPIKRLDEEIGKLPRSRTIVTYCT